MVQINATKLKNDKPAKPAPELDMYADDFDEKEKANLTAASTSKDETEPEESKNRGTYTKFVLVFTYATLVNFRLWRVHFLK